MDGKEKYFQNDKLKLDQHERMGWQLSKSLNKRYYLILKIVVMAFVPGPLCIYHQIHE